MPFFGYADHFSGFGRAGTPAALAPIVEGPHWPSWPEDFQLGVASQITKPGVRGGGIGGLGAVHNNLAKMLKWFENRQREWGREGAAQMRALGFEQRGGEWVMA